jgi:Flagellar transcriptional activator (FlhD).
MGHREVINEIGEFNLSYLLLAQRLLKDDRQTGMCRLGIGAELAGSLESLSLSQIVKLAASNFVLCRFRIDDRTTLSMLTEDDKNAALRQAHAAILLAAQDVEELG